MPLYVGADPGLSGGLAILDEDGDVLTVIPMPTKLGARGKTLVSCSAIWDFLEGAAETWGEIKLVTMEENHARDTDAKDSIWSFARTTGRLEAVIELLELPMLTPTPQAWKAEMLRDTDKSKEAAIGYVQQRYPGVNLLATARSRKPHDGMAESVLMAEFGRRKLKGGVL